MEVQMKNLTFVITVRLFLSKDLDVLFLRCIAQLSGQPISSQESDAMASIFSFLPFHFLETHFSKKMLKKKKTL